jgi:hypothetical protein
MDLAPLLALSGFAANGEIANPGKLPARRTVSVNLKQPCSQT